MKNCKDVTSRMFLEAAKGNHELARKWTQSFSVGDPLDNSNAFFVALYHLETGQVRRGEAEMKALRWHINVTKKDKASRLMLLPKIRTILSNLRRGHFQRRMSLTIASRRRETR